MRAVETFAQGLEQDGAAVRAALTTRAKCEKSRDFIITIIHELIHSLRMVRGQNKSHLNHQVKYLGMDGVMGKVNQPIEETLTIGTPGVAGEQPAENDLRKHLGLPFRQRHLGLEEDECKATPVIYKPPAPVKPRR